MLFTVLQPCQFQHSCPPHCRSSAHSSCCQSPRPPFKRPHLPHRLPYALFWKADQESVKTTVPTSELCLCLESAFGAHSRVLAQSWLCPLLMFDATWRSTGFFFFFLTLKALNWAPQGHKPIVLICHVYLITLLSPRRFALSPRPIKYICGRGCDFTGPILV